MATERERNRGSGAYSSVPETPPEKGPSPIITGAPIVKFQFQNISPPSSVYVTRDDQLKVTVFNAFAALQIGVRFRILRPDGVIQPNQFTIAPVNNRAAQQFTFGLTEGYLLSVQLNADVGGPNRGQCFVSAFLTRPSTQAPAGFWTLVSDYLDDLLPIGWPGGRVQQSQEGPGNERVVIGTTPAAGADASDSVPTNARWRLIAANYTLTTAVAAANREVVFFCDDGGANVLAQSPSGFSQAASLARTYTFTVGGTRYDAAVATRTNAPVAAVILGSGMRLRTLTSNIQAADQFSAITYHVEEWIES